MDRATALATAFKAPRGFRRHIYRGNALRHVTRGILGRCGLRTRIARLRFLRQHPDRALAHIRARILCGLTNCGLIICAVMGCVVRALAAPALDCADTS